MTPLEQVGPLADVPLDFEVEIDRRPLRAGDLLSLSEGSVLPLSRSAGDNMDIYVGGALLGFGEIVIIENTMGIRITDFKGSDA